MDAVTILWTFLLGLGCARGGSYEPRNGDIVFQTSRSAQSVAIQKATRSPWSHLGIVYLRGGRSVPGAPLRLLVRVVR